MRYYKWMFEDENEVRRVPGFVFVSLADAVRFSADFDDWTVGTGRKQLFEFDGVAPTPIKQFLVSYFGYREPPWPVRKLSESELRRALAFFADQDDDYFTTRDGQQHIPLMLSVAATVGCIKYQGSPNRYVSSVEAFYAQAVTMTAVRHPAVVAATMADID